ncbi:MFS transporter [Pandoraea commovens]|uniref:MFS transporter n=1 Tax=Pandoraea commovens TaxID=2508289 RepID=A0A5E4XS51_9BURK|nr:MFS transporter [Pandoraea commovens]UVA80896.1 MFS transporter [Pandoraea commovens]VVE39197.1 MFS transporter [Pandoraea commovens]
MLETNTDTPGKPGKAGYAARARRAHYAGVGAWLGLLALVVVTFFANVDRQMLVLLAELIRAEFGLADIQVGLLQGAGIALFAGAAAIPIGWLADRMDRRVVLALCILLWSAATAACGLATGFWTLFIASIGLGIGEAGLMPIIYGLLPDLFPARQRILANSVFAMVNLLSAGAGMALGGLLIQGIDTLHGALPFGLAATSAWRIAFFAVAVPAPLLVLIVAMIRPRYAHSDVPSPTGEAAAPGFAAGDYFRREMPMMLRFFGAIALINMAFAGVTSWMPVVAVRFFGDTPATAGAGLGSAAMVGSVIGCVLGWLVARRLTARLGVLAPLRVCEWGALGACVVSLGYLIAPSVSYVYLLFGAQFMCVVAGMIMFPGLMQSICPPYLRSRVAAIGVLTTVLMQSGSPVAIGLMSDHLHGTATGLIWAIVAVSLSGFIVACLLMRNAANAVRLAIERYA